ncbi:MAG: alpha-amylase family glycosyl hydrolase [Bacteroidales bacterium]
MNRIYLLLLAFSVTLFSCQEETPAPDNGNNNNDSTYTQYGTPFDQVPATEDIVMYEVNLRAFSASGDIQGVLNKMDHIEELGVNVIWLMPVHPIGQVNSVNSPYSVSDHKAVGAEFGTLEDLRDLTDEAHSRGMAVIMDWVANHTAWDHEWIENKSWYTQDGNGNIIHPPGTNWQDVADLNYGNDQMREAMIDAMKYWVVEANVDGFRCDYADGVPYDFWRDAFVALDSIPEREYIFFAEGTRSDHFAAGFDLNFSWQHYGALLGVYNGDPATRIFTAHVDEYENTPEGKHWVRFSTNHDESAWDATPIVLYNGVEGALAASVATIFTGGVPLIYSSQEVGTASNVPFFSNSTINWNNNPGMLEDYQTMLQFYAGSPVARNGQNTVYPHNDVVFFKKTYQEEELLILANMRNTSLSVSIPAALENTTWTDVMTQSSHTLSGMMELAPYEFVILE